jgi:hypothetical protein
MRASQSVQRSRAARAWTDLVANGVLIFFFHGGSSHFVSSFGPTGRDNLTGKKIGKPVGHGHLATLRTLASIGKGGRHTEEQMKSQLLCRWVARVVAAYG